ncbi:uncharacterized protein LOC126108225 [Schistocerca cancellata]|uniref:uncharacterized protein LOC126108225 n=1 Tax=Schistocerca cancellata TaxID=274614 RepID=UPI0021197519|nr:uncharacterized protein LOC126108225 [Schistocerca cancellata]
MTLSEQIQGQRRSSKKSKNKAQASGNTAPAATNSNPRTKPEAQQKKARKSGAGNTTAAAAAAAAAAAKDPKRDRRSTLPATRDAAAEGRAGADAAPASGSGLQGRDRGLRGSFKALRRSTEDLSNAASAIKKTIGSFVRSSPLRRSFSFGRDLNKVGGLKKTAWSASLQSLQEDVPEEEAGAGKFLVDDKRDSFIEDEEDAELMKEQRAVAKPTDAVVGVPTKDLEFKTRSLVIEDSGAYSKDPEFQDLSEVSRRRTQSYSAVQRVGLLDPSDEADTTLGSRSHRPHSLSAYHLAGERGNPLELERLLPARSTATLPAKKPMRQNSESSTLFSRGFWHDVFSKGRSLSLSHIEQAGVEQERPAAHAASSSAGLTPAARAVQPGQQPLCAPQRLSLGPLCCGARLHTLRLRGIILH